MKDIQNISTRIYIKLHQSEITHIYTPMLINDVNVKHFFRWIATTSLTSRSSFGMWHMKRRPAFSWRVPTSCIESGALEKWRLPGPTLRVKREITFNLNTILYINIHMLLLYTNISKLYPNMHSDTILRRLTQKQSMHLTKIKCFVII